MRDNPRFREDFKNVVESVYGEDAYALKMCLGGDALQTAKGTEGSYNEMIQRLDNKYGNTRKVMDLVISDLKALKRIKGLLRLKVLQRWWIKWNSVG